jgi:hypothetical protein
MGNSCANIPKIEPIIINKTIINIERSFRHSKQSYQENCKLANVRFNDRNIFHSNQNSIIEAEIVEHKSIPRVRELASDEFAKIMDYDDIQDLDNSVEIIENIMKELLKAKILIDNCTYDESRRRFHYSVVPFADIFH